MFSIFRVILVVALQASAGISLRVKDVTLPFSAFFFLHFCLFCCSVKS